MALSQPRLPPGCRTLATHSEPGWWACSGRGATQPPPQSFTLLRAPRVSFADGLFVTDYFTRTPRKLSPFRSFASIELFHFHIPEDTVIAVWNLITFKEQGGTFGDQCPDRSITV